jgi:hypothetical protein
MTIPNQNAIVYRANTAQLLITLTMADGTPYNPAIDAEIKYRIARNWHTPEADALVSKSNAVGEGITVAGQIATIELSATDTDLEPGLYHHELKIIKAPDISTSMTGTVVVRKAMKMVTPAP